MGADRPPAPRSNRVTGRKAARLDAKKRGCPSRVKWSTWIWHRQKWRGWPRLTKVGTQRRRSAPRTHDHAQGRGLGRPTSKNASTARMQPRNPPTRCAAADLAGRAR